MLWLHMFFYSWFCEFIEQKLCLMHLIFTFYFLSTSELKNHVNLMSTAVLNFCVKAALKAATVLFGITSMNANCACVTILRVAMRCSRNLRQLKQRTQTFDMIRDRRGCLCAVIALCWCFWMIKTSTAAGMYDFSCSICYGLHYYTRGLLCEFIIWVRNKDIMRRTCSEKPAVGR